MKALGRYDTTLQMFVDEPRDPDPAHLRFLRYLVETGRLERDAPVPHPTQPTATIVYDDGSRYEFWCACRACR